MKNFIIAGFLILGLLCPVFAVDKTELPSETGIVESIQYEDVDGLQQGDNSVKQVALVKVLSGKYKGTERLIDNMLTGNPAYDINLNKGDKVILHAERKSDEIIDADDVDFFIADIKRDSALLWISALFVLLLLAIGRKKGVYSLLSIIATVALIFFMLMPMILSGFCPIASAVLVGILSTVITRL